MVKPQNSSFIETVQKSDPPLPPTFLPYPILYITETSKVATRPKSIKPGPGRIRIRQKEVASIVAAPVNVEEVAAGGVVASATAAAGGAIC